MNRKETQDLEEEIGREIKEKIETKYESCLKFSSKINLPFLGETGKYNFVLGICKGYFPTKAAYEREMAFYRIGKVLESLSVTKDDPIVKKISKIEASFKYPPDENVLKKREKRYTI